MSENVHQAKSNLDFEMLRLDTQRDLMELALKSKGPVPKSRLLGFTNQVNKVIDRYNRLLTAERKYNEAEENEQSTSQ